jgi:hypothetical protein
LTSEISWKRLLLYVAIVVGIGVPSLVLGLTAVEGWHLPNWAAVSMPIILIGSVRGTAVLFGWKAVRWSWPRFKEWRKRQQEEPGEPSID